jgi:hypothetical protein
VSTMENCILPDRSNDTICVERPRATITVERDGCGYRARCGDESAVGMTVERAVIYLALHMGAVNRDWEV